MDQPVILCGLGRVGWRVLEYLHAAGVPMVAIDDHCSPTDPRLGNVRLVRGDCRQPDVLQQAGVAGCGGVLILTSDDLVNITTALMVRHLRPGVRIVVRMFNPILIPRLGKAVANIFGLSTSDLTAPLLALTALAGDTLGTFTVDDSRRQVAELTVGDYAAVRGQTIAEAAARHRALVLAYLPVRGPERFLLDVDPAARLAPGDHLVLCGAPDDLAPLLTQLTDDVLPHLRWAGWLRRSGRVLWRTLTEVDLAVKVCTSVLLTVVVVSTLVYYLGVNKALPDALYRTISVIATGADMHEAELKIGWHKVFVSVLRITGAALVAAFTAIVTNFLLRARLRGALEIRRIPDSGHVIVCGLGNVGFRVVEELLRAGERVVVIERSRDSRFMATSRQLGAAVILGDATVLEVLRQAHTATARALVATTDSELVNLEVALLARELNPHQRVVLRMSDPQLAQTLREAANVRLALSLPNLAAPAFVAALFGDRVQTVFLVAGRPLAAIDLVVQPDDLYLSGQSVHSLAVDHRLLPVHFHDHGGQESDPVGAGQDGSSIPQRAVHERLRTGDRLTAIVTLPDLERLTRRERPPADCVVELTAFPAEARSALVELLHERLRISPEAAAAALDQLPARLPPLTRGQADDLLFFMQQHRATAVLQGFKTETATDGTRIQHG